MSSDQMQVSASHPLEEQIREGEQALADGDKEKALALFEALLEKAPDDKHIQQRLKRVQLSDQVQALLEVAEQLEKADQLEAAKQKYEEVFALDPFSKRTQQGKSRVERTLREQQFLLLLSAAQAAEEQEDWSQAALHYEEASQIYPDRSDVKEALEALREKQKQQIKELLGEAYALENQWGWESARERYLEILKQASSHVEAKQGLLRVGEVIRALIRYKTLLARAHNKAASGRYPAAIEAFNEAMSLKPNYLPVDPQVLVLRGELERQREPVTVNFRSDKSTWVRIAGFELLGKFRGKQVKIIPNVYQIQGKRRGYHDTEFELRVQQGMPLEEITVNV